MLRAIELARATVESGAGGPFGAVVVRDGQILGEGANRVLGTLDPTAHAEVVAIRAACEKVRDFSLRGAEIFTTCEPCPMCLGAIYWARLDRIWYASTRSDAAKAGFDDDFLYRELPLLPAERTVPAERVLLDDAEALMQLWCKKADRVDY